MAATCRGCGPCDVQAIDEAVVPKGRGRVRLAELGPNGDIPVGADYDGDGKAEVAVLRPTNGQWYIVQSSAGILYLPFGQDGDVPTQSAFDCSQLFRCFPPTFF